MALQEETTKVNEEISEQVAADEEVNLKDKLDEQEDIQVAEVVSGTNQGADPDDLSQWENTEKEDKELWTSRTSFILAAIGSAVGLGNFWRFPFQVYQYGGGTFFIPYFFALFVVGVPMMQLEMAVGQVFRRAAMQAFARLHPSMGGIGLAGAWLAFSVVTYYIAILAWGNVMLIKSFYKDMPWDIRGVNGSDVVDIPAGHFGSAILQGAPTTIIPSFIDTGLLTGGLVVWFLVWWILINGQAFISKAVWVTVLMPVAMLLILLIVGASLDGAGDGIQVYLTEWDFDELSNAEMWTDAFGQVFFSLGLAFGTMPAYASFNPRNQNIVQDAFIISMCDALFSFFAGFAVFTIVGFFSFSTGVPIADLPIGGASLAFVTYPAGLSLLNGAWANLTCIMFFVTFFFLGIDSAFSLIEAVVHNVHETVRYAGWSREALTTYIVQISVIVSLFYITDNGIYWLDYADTYINSFGVFGIGFLEAFTAMWMFNKKYTMKMVGRLPVQIFDYGFWGSMTLFIILVFTLPEKDSFQVEVPEGSTKNSWDSGKTLLISCLVLFFGILFTTIAALSQKKQGISNKDALYYITLHGPDTLKNMLNRTITKDAPGNWKFNLFWAFTVKFLVCPTLFILFFTKFSGMVKAGGFDLIGGATPIDEGFQVFYNIFGGLIMLVAVVLVVGGVLFPKKFRDAKGERIAREKLTEQV